MFDDAAQMRLNISRDKARMGQVTPTEFVYLAAAFGEAARALPKPPEVASLSYRDSAMTVKVKPESVDPSATEIMRAALALRKVDLTDSGGGVWVVSSKGGRK